MNIGVLVKASLDPNIIRVDSQGKLLLNEIPLAISEYDRNAVEEAVKIKEKLGGKVIVISVLTWGPIAKRAREAEQVMREALAMGADEAHLVVDEKIIPGNPLTTSLVITQLLRKLQEKEKIELLLTGEGSMDTTSFQLVGRISELLGINGASFAKKIEIEDKKVLVTRDLEGYLETIELELPAILSVTGEINKPRLPTLLQIRRAFAKPLNKYTLQDLGLTIEKSGVEIEDITLLSVSRKNILIEKDSPEEAVEELVKILEKEGLLG